MNDRIRLAVFGGAAAVSLLGVGLFLRLDTGRRAGPQTVAGAGGGSPVPGTVGEFTLTDATGRPFGSRQLAGSVWVADFIFTRCTGPCPLLTERMKQLDRELPRRADLRLVTFTVDPAYDTPGVLREYVVQRGALSDRWVFLTGDRRILVELLRSRLKLPLGAPAFDAGQFVVPHTEKFVLVARDGSVRGLYDTSEPRGLERVKRDCLVLTGRQ